MQGMQQHAATCVHSCLSMLPPTGYRLLPPVAAAGLSPDKFITHAGVIEAVGWTKGSPHRQMLRHKQPWYVQLQLDTAAFLFLTLSAAIYCMVWGVHRLWQYMRPAPATNGQACGMLKKQL